MSIIILLIPGDNYGRLQTLMSGEGGHRYTTVDLRSNPM